MTIKKVIIEGVEVELNDHYCPVCWGYHEYDNMIRDVVRDRQIDVQNHVVAQTFIQKWVEENLDGVRLKEMKCHTCSEKCE